MPLCKKCGTEIKHGHEICPPCLTEHRARYRQEMDRKNREKRHTEEQDSRDELKIFKWIFVIVVIFIKFATK